MDKIAYFFLPIFGIILGVFISKFSIFEKYQSFFLHFVSGVILGVAAIDITPVIAFSKDSKGVLIAFFLGIVFIFFLQLIEKKTHSSKKIFKIKRTC